MTKDGALKLALEAFEDAKRNHGLVYVTELCAIREALAEPEMSPAFRTSHAYSVGFQDGKALALAKQPAQQELVAEILEALKNLVMVSQHLGACEATVEDARNAIAKATGEQK